MKVYKNPDRSEWADICLRPHLDVSSLNSAVSGILDDVRLRGDEAVKEYEAKFDHAVLGELMVSEEEKAEAMAVIDRELLDAIRLAHDNIHKFHKAQLMSACKVETAPGVVCWQKQLPIERVGLYIPGGTAPLFSTVLMLATPAKIAGCSEIVLCTPPMADGKVNPAILAAANVVGVDKVFKIGGVQAIGAMAYGTQSVPKVYKIFGPGNQYVMAAKQHVSLHEVAIDLLSQAEHGIDSQVLLVSTSDDMIDSVQQQIELQLAKLPRREIAMKTLENSKAVLVSDTDEAIELSNAYAPEHLIIATADYERLAERVVNAGSVFLGDYACESAGDYASGTNHTLPTHGYATAYNGVNIDSFMRKVTFQHLSAEGIRSIGRAVEVMAAAEHLDAHRNAMSVRMAKLNSTH